jgi:uncharacterized protein (TIGR02996 family)
MTHDAFLQAILDEPEDDTPRLVYADWLDDNGDPARAEFIRLQCRLAGLAEDDPQRPALARRERELLDAHSEAWAAPLCKLAPGNPLFKRGFVEWAAVDVDTLLGKARQLFRLAPLRRLCVLGAVADPAALFALPQLARLTELDLPEAGLNYLGAHKLAACPFLANLTALSLDNNYLDEAHRIKDRGAAALAKSPHLARLTKLCLRHNDITARGVAALAASPHLTRLTTLDLSSNYFGDEGAAALAATPSLASLTRLELQGCRLGPAGGADLAASPHLANLTWLNLNWNRLGPDGATALARSPHLARLRTLKLESNDLGDLGVVALAESPHRCELTDLDLTENELTPEGMSRLLARAAWPKLRRLAFGANPLDDSVGAALAASPLLAGLAELDAFAVNWTAKAVQRLTASGALGNLTSLELSSNPVGDEGAKALAGCSQLARLRHLGLYGNEEELLIDDGGARAIAEARHWTGLESLALDSNAIGDEGALALARSPTLAGLRSLHMEGNPLSPAGKEALRDRFGERVSL